MGKQTSDAERMQNVLDSLSMNPHQMAAKLGYKSHASVYHVVNGLNALSEGMIERIVRAYPRVNYNYLKDGEEPVLLEKDQARAQMNYFNIVPQDAQDYIRFTKFMEIPDQLDRIEEKLDLLLGRSGPDV